MKVLAVDTSSLVAAVAVMEDERLLGEYVLNQQKNTFSKAYAYDKRNNGQS
ncbi:MAG: hypothetical protein ACOX7R_12600 [Acetivibrionales bacterium]